MIFELDRKQNTDVFDDKIIGYDSVKDELRKIADTVRNPEKYNQEKATLIKGVLLAGAPGTGKSTLARCFVEYCRKCAVYLRKTAKNDKFHEQINEAFETAKQKNAILVLEDLDKFCENPSKYASEWATLQSAVDEHASDGIFILATVNDVSIISPSLIRPGRFDLMLHVNPPKGKAAEKIMRYYLRNRKLGEDVDIEELAILMKGRSCSDLETVVNHAEVSRIYEGCSVIQRTHMLEAVLHVVFDLRNSEGFEDPEYKRKVALHEAAHCTISEYCKKGSTVFTALASDSESRDGMTLTSLSTCTTAEDLISNVMICLAGKAVGEIYFNKNDCGAGMDLTAARNGLYKYITHCGGTGLGLIESDDERFSEHALSNIETIISSRLEELYRETNRILISEREFLEKLADELMEKGVLTYKEITKIESSLEK